MIPHFASRLRHMLDFVIAGPPKAGTSSLYRWLADHPGIQGSVPKESFFLVDPDDLHTRSCTARTVHQSGIEGYHAFFPEPRDGRLRFEATTVYYRQRTALTVLADMESRPLIVFILRDPAKRLLSAFLYNREHGQSIARDVDFATYVDKLLAGDSKALEPFCTQAHCSALSHMLERGHYVEWLQSWRERVGTERLHLILFDDMITNPRQELYRLCHRLGLETSFYDSYAFTHHNRTIMLKHAGIHRLKTAFSPLVPAAAKARLRNWYYRMQEREPHPLESASQIAALARLDNHFAPWNARLADEFGLNLGAWGASPRKSEGEQ
jgi:hypothetical protein